MERPKASTALALLLSAAGAVGGCSAQTNTLDLDTGARHYSFRKAEIEEIVADGRSFAVLPRTNTNIQVGNQVLASEAVLPFELVPYDHSMTVRTKKRLTVVPKDEVYFLVNAECGSDGSKINPSAEPKRAFFVLGRTQLPSHTETDRWGIVQEREFKRTTQERGYVEIGDRQYLEVPIKNPFGGPNVAFLDVRTIKPVYIEDRRSCGNKEASSGVTGVGYFPVPGRQIAQPSEPQAEIRPLPD